MRRRVTYRPSKAQGIFGMVWGGVFILIGLFVAVPTFGPFGLLWTIAAIAITAMNGYQAFGKTYAGPEINIEEEDPGRPGETPPFSPDAGGHNHISSVGPSAQTRLEQLETLKGAGLITEQEYRQKRQEILKEL